MEAWRQELYHHGIKGQRWGQKNGPPYPLDYSQHSAKEKKLNAKSSISNEHKDYLESSSKKGLTSGQKKAIIIGTAAAATALAVVGGVYLAKTGKINGFIGIGKSKVSNLYGNADKLLPPKVVDKFGLINGDHSWNDDLAVINPFRDEQGVGNCGASSLALLERRNNGLNIISKRIHGMNWDDIETIYPGSEHKTLLPLDNFSEIGTSLLTKFKDGDNGILGLNSRDTSKIPNHFITWSKEGESIIFRDGQKGWTMNSSDPKFKPLMDKFSEIWNMDKVDYMQINDKMITDDISILTKYFSIG